MTRRSTTAIAAAIAAIGSSATAYAEPARVPNKQPYRVTATATATGRTGSATMSARALIDRDHKASLEVVAGDFETPPVGTLTKIQLKTYDGNADLLYTNNVSGFSAPAVVMPLSGVDRGQALNVQGNIRNVDNTRTDVVSVTTVGRLRPDLAVLRLNVPASARAGMLVHVSATIAELNNDTGARATCLLSVDDAPVDRADGIWVDAGDTVSCAFTHLFAIGGLHQIRVDVTDVNPGDWDTANNGATGSLAVVTDEESFAAVSAWVNSSLEHYRAHNTGFARRSLGGDYVRTYDFLTDRSSNMQGAEYHGHLDTPISFPLTQIAVAQWSDDTLIHQAVFRTLAATLVALNLTCGRAVDDADQAAYVEVCAYSGVPGGHGTTSLTYSRYVGTVTYFSNHYDAAWYETPDGIIPIYTYSYNSRDSSSVGSIVPLGSTYRFDVTLIDGSVAYSKPMSFPIGPLYTYSDINYPWRCQEFTDPTYGYKKVCDEYINFSSGRSGFLNSR